MNKDICTILVSGSDTERQTIFYVPDENALYSTLDLAPIDTYPIHSVAEAVKMCDAMWGAGPWWDLQWIIEDYEEEEAPMTYQEFKQNIWKTLNLDNRSITFFLLEVNGDAVTFGSGIIDNSGDLWESDELYEIGEAASYKEKLEVYGVESWMLGDGEADHADDHDLEILRDAYTEYPTLFDDLLVELGENLVNIDYLEIDNPAYEEHDDDDDDWDNDEDHDD